YFSSINLTFADVSPETASSILMGLWRNVASGNYKPHDHGLQPENLLQDHHSNSGRESPLVERAKRKEKYSKITGITQFSGS
ncbi:hypothetical protein L9F63_001657, partial [Diploptera punctata]